MTSATQPHGTRGPALRPALCLALCLAPLPPLGAGQFSLALADPGNVHDAPVPGFTGPHGDGKARLPDGQGGTLHPANYVSPLFFGWAAEVEDYARSDGQAPFSEPGLALGEVTGDDFDVVSLGDLDREPLDAWLADPAANPGPGTVTLRFTPPIRNFSGADFAVFENGIIAGSATGGAGIGGLFAELAAVEVSADGASFVRFPATSLTPAAVGGYGTLDPTAIHNLAGKHANAHGECWGTPFDLAQVGLDEAAWVRLVDVPGSGDFTDSGGRPVFDSWPTFGSGGADIEAVGAISVAMSFADWPQLQRLPAAHRGESADPDGDGWPNLVEYAFAMLPWHADTGTPPLRVEWPGGPGQPPELVFRRDERLLDVTCELCASADLQTWTPLAHGSGGAPVAPVNGQPVTVTESRAGSPATVGVLREVRVRDAGAARGPRFYRVEVTLRR